MPEPVAVDPEEVKRVLRPLPPPGRGPAAAPKTRRPVETVPPAELRKMRDEVLRDYGNCPDDVVYREIARRLGYGTLSPKARSQLESVLGGRP